MKVILSLTTAILALTLVCSQAARAQAYTYTYTYSHANPGIVQPVAGFDSIIVSGPIELVIMDNVHEARVVGKGKRGYGAVINKEGENTVRISRTANVAGKKTRVAVPNNSYRFIRAENSAEIRFDKYIHSADTVTIELHKADLTIGRANCGGMKINAYDARIEITGKSDELRLAMNGYSKAEMYNFAVQDVYVDARNGSRAKVYAAREFSGWASSASEVRFKGPGNVLVLETTTGGVIKGK